MKAAKTTSLRRRIHCDVICHTTARRRSWQLSPDSDIGPSDPTLPGHSWGQYLVGTIPRSIRICVPNVVMIGPAVWPPILDRQTHTHTQNLYYIDIDINDFPEYLLLDSSLMIVSFIKKLKQSMISQNLQLDLDAACRWEKDWLMHFHPDKCNLISITQKRKPIHFTYKLHDHPLAKVEHSKYLGITLQSSLKLNKHINSITNKANQSLGFLKRNLKIKSSAVTSHAYKAFVRPKLEYASAVWDPHTRTQINQNEKVQRRAARYVTNRYHNTSSVTDMLQNLNWPSLEIRRTRVRLIMFYKIIHHVVAIHPLDTLLLPTTTITRFNSSHTYQHIRTDKDSYKYSFYPRTIIQWNLFPIHVHEAVTVDAFKALVPVTVLAPIYHV